MPTPDHLSFCSSGISWSSWHPGEPRPSWRPWREGKGVFGCGGWGAAFVLSVGTESFQYSLLGGCLKGWYFTGPRKEGIFWLGRGVIWCLPHIFLHRGRGLWKDLGKSTFILLRNVSKWCPGQHPLIYHPDVSHSFPPQGPPGRAGLPGSDGAPGPPGTSLMLPVSSLLGFGMRLWGVQGNCGVSP